MIRKVLFALAATLVVGASTLATIDDASAARGNGMSRGGGSARMSGGASMRRTSVGRPSGISRRAPNIGRTTFHRPGGHRPGLHRPGHRKVAHHHHRRHGSFGGHHRRYGSFGGHHHRHGSHGRFHRRGWSWGGGTYVTYGGAPVVYGTPARATPVSAPVCDSCGGWTQDGCYMTYRKVVDANGQPTLKCVKACDDQAETQTQQGS